MSRQARIDAPGGVLHHIICRGIERRNILKDITDRNRFLKRLGSVFKRPPRHTIAGHSFSPLCEE